MVALLISIEKRSNAKGREKAVQIAYSLMVFTASMLLLFPVAEV